MERGPWVPQTSPSCTSTPSCLCQGGCGSHGDCFHPSQRTPLEGTGSPSPCGTPREEQGGDSPHSHLTKGLGDTQSMAAALGTFPCQVTADPGCRWGREGM